MDPLRLITQIISANDQDRLDDLQQLKTLLESQPNLFTIICQTALPSLPRLNANLKAWLLDELVANALTKVALPLDQRTSLAQKSLDVIGIILNDTSPRLKKLAVQCFTDAYPLLFRHCCLDPSQPGIWDKTTHLKNTILNIWTTSSPGPRVAATKLVQRIIQTQTRAAVDPRVTNRLTVEPNLALCPSHHPFMNSQSLEDEAKRLLEECIKTLYISNVPDIVSGIVNAFATLVKARPALANSIYTSLVNWEPNALASCTPLQVKGVEKTFRIAVAHLLKSGSASTFTAQVTDFLHKQNTRMLQAAEVARKKRDEEASKKRSRITDELNSMATVAASNKRRKIDPSVLNKPTVSTSQTFAIGSKPGEAANPFAEFDVTTLPVTLVAELIIANLQVVTDANLAMAINEIRQHLAAIGVKEGSSVDADPVASGPVNPLSDEEEDLQLPAYDEDSDDEMAPTSLEAFELPLPEAVSDETHAFLCNAAISRIFGRTVSFDDQLETSLWNMLITRMAARLPIILDTDSKHTVQQALSAYISQDPSSRLDVAKLWLNEHWYSRPQAESISTVPEVYEEYLLVLIDQIADAAGFDAKALPSFLLDLPVVTRTVCERLKRFCESTSQMQLGFPALRDLSTLQPTAQSDALDMLLTLCTHSEKPSRNAAILTVKKWVPEHADLSQIVVSFALQLLTKLEAAPISKEKGDGEDEDMETEEDTSKMVTLVESGQLKRGPPPPDSELHVVQHIELLLALCTKMPDLLDSLFLSYSKMNASVQSHVDNLITMLIRSMGAKHPKILELIRNSNQGSESLVLRIIAILSEKGKASPALVGLIKEMAEQRDLNPRYLVPILPEMEKSEIINNLPKIVSMLSNQESDRALVAQVFESIMAPPETFGISSNAPRTNKSELLTPVELLVELHRIDDGANVKLIIEAIGLCLSMSDIFRTDILAAFMQQVMDEPVLPMLYLRTVIQTVTMYKSLQPYISSTLLNRLITKKVWTNPQQWEGFIRLARAIVPHSFDAILSLPKEPLDEFLTKQPALREPLRQHVMQKYSANKNRMTYLLEAIGNV